MVEFGMSSKRYGCCRCSESAVKATSCSPPYSPCPYPSSSRVATPPISQPAATLPVVRPALERALLQSNRRFWDENPTAEDKMADQCPRRRSRQAMQFFLRLHILVACKGMAASIASSAVDTQHVLSIAASQDSYNMYAYI